MTDQHISRECSIQSKDWTTQWFIRCQWSRCVLYSCLKGLVVQVADRCLKPRSRGVKIGARDKDLQTRTDFTNNRSRDRRERSLVANIRAQFHSPHFSAHEHAYSSSKFLPTGYTGRKDCCSVVHLGHSDFVNKFRISKQRLATSDLTPIPRLKLAPSFDYCFL